METDQEDSGLGNVKTKAEAFGWDAQDLKIRETCEGLARKSGECQQPNKKCSLAKVIQARGKGAGLGEVPVVGEVQCLDFKSWEIKCVTVRERERARTGFQFWEEGKQVKEAGTLAKGSQTGTFSSLTGGQHASRDEEGETWPGAH